MEKLPETLYVDPTGASSPTARKDSASVERAKVEYYIRLLHQPLLREEALALLNKERKSDDMAVLVWNSKNVPFILLQEIMAAYKLLSPPVLDMKEATRVCNAVALFQAMASHPDTRMEIVKARVPVYIYPFMNTTENRLKHFDYLRLTSLGVIGALVKVAAFVISKILMYEEGQRYCGTFPERFYAISNVLGKALDKYPGKPPMQLLKHILTCFKRLTEVSRACDAMSKCYPAKLRDPAYLNFACEDLAVRRLADQVLQNVTVHRTFC
ncbi:CCR4-NOT transcription complex subunit 9 [Artemisia annua]|uniref:CCR4-NOT transcription complex subunit 9 n=1 Tax=Artemisia annua TaxID=35608 RepID=A0A2U1NQ09_ARTAN|nr:CCR4-NOT transcription complex subunit 9 [Artemisia annua]